jgi:hypothetical protein
VEFWQPEPGAAALLEWFDPLVALARRARARSCAVPIYIDEFTFRGRMSSRARGPISVYEHVESGRELLADARGCAYRFVRHRTGRSPGRFVEIQPDDAAWQVLADVTPMKLSRRARAVTSQRHAEAMEHHPAAPRAEVGDTGTEGRTVRHLRVIDCTGVE